MFDGADRTLSNFGWLSVSNSKQANVDNINNNRCNESSSDCTITRNDIGPFAKKQFDDKLNNVKIHYTCKDSSEIQNISNAVFGFTH